MAGPDLSGMSDEELLSIANSQKKSPAETGDLRSLSDEELLRALGQEPPSPGFSETAKDVGKSLAAGALKGVAGLADLPMDVAGLAVSGGEWLSGAEAPSWMSDPIERSQGFYKKKMSDVTGGFSERTPETTAGRYASTVGEFVPAAIGAGITGGGSLGAQLGRAGLNVARGAVLPGIASEGLGQAAEGTSAEPYARLAGAILGGFGANFGENALRGVISPGGGGRAVNLADADLLRRQKIDVSAGQATDSQAVRAIESGNPTIQALTSVSPDSPQLKQLTEAALRHAGLTDDVIERVAANPALGGLDPNVASRPMIDELLNVNGAKFRDALSGVPAKFTNKFVNETRNALDQYRPVPGYQPVLPPLTIRSIGSELSRSFSTGVPIPASRLQEMRSSLGDLLGDQTHGSAAKALRDALDGAIEDSVAAVGQPERMEKLLKAREEYWSILGIEDAVTRSKLGAYGIITPDALAAGVKSAQGKRMTASGRGMPMSDLADAARRTIRPIPPREGGLAKKLIPALDIGTIVGAGYGIPQLAAMASTNPMIAAALTGTAGTVAAVDLAKRAALKIASEAAHTRTGRRYLENQLVNPSSGVGYLSAGTRGALYGAPSYVDTREGRKSGGRVNSSHHEAAADQLVAAAERAKKGISKGTESLLEMPDEHIAHALEIANRSI